MIKKIVFMLWLVASSEAVQFTPSFLDYSSNEEKRENLFDQLKETMSYTHRARRLGHTLPSFVVPRQCDYEALNHGTTSTNPVDQFTCPNQCGSGRDFTLRVSTRCDRPYVDASAVCSSVIDCYVDGCTDSCSNQAGGCPCPPVDILDINTALREVCNVLCVAPPVPAPVAAPVPVPVPVPAPVPAPVTAPVPAPVAAPVPAPVAAPVPAPVPAPVTAPQALPVPIPGPVPVPAPGPIPAPVTGPVFVPTPAAVPVFVPSPVTGPVFVPSPVSGPPVIAPVIAPIPAPTPDLPNCYRDTTLLLQAIVNADTSVVTTYSLCSNQVYNIGTLLNTADGTTLTGGMAPLTARTNSHFICGATGEVTNNCVLTGGEVQVISAFNLYQESVTNCRFQGFTFSMAAQAGATLGNSGDITFQDCIFEQHSNVGAMLLTWDPTETSMEPPLNIGGGIAQPQASNVGGLRNLQKTDPVQRVLDNMGVVIDSLRQQNKVNPPERGLRLKNEVSTANTRDTTFDQEFISENHSIPPSKTPPGCAYSFQHSDTVFMDEIFCPGWCGDGQDFTYTVTSVCSGNDCETFADCRVQGCTDQCGEMVGDCACTSQDFDSIFDNVCQDVCTAQVPVPVAPPVLPPIAGPTPTVPVPTPALPTPALPTPALPTPALPTPALPTPALPTPALPTPALPTPALPTPALPTPVLPTPALPTPALPTPALPTPALPTPVVPPAPTPGTPTDPSLPRQRIFLSETTFRNNIQGSPLNEASRGVITTTSGYNDLTVDFSNFRSNTFNSEGFGYGILAVEGSSVQISNTNFVDNDFIGVGSVVVLDNGSVTASNNFGTFDEGLFCQFIAASPSTTNEVSCIEFDRTTEVPPPTPTPPGPAPTPDMQPVIGKRESLQPVIGKRESLQNRQSQLEGGRIDDASSMIKGSSTTTRTKTTRKSKSSTYCGDGSGNDGRRCLKRKPI